MSSSTRYTRNILVIVAVGFILIILPRFFGDYYIHMATMILLYGYLGLAWNILGGYAGQFSFGHAAFFGVGAFTSTLLQLHMGVNPWIGMFLAGIAGMLLGLFIGTLCFRYGLRGPYFALAMLAVAEMLRLLAVQWMTVKYPLGINIPINSSFWNFQFNEKAPYYYIILSMTAAALYLTHIIDVKRIGSYFKAIRENEEAAESLGINLFKYKLIAMSISSFLTAMAGTFYAQYYLIVDEEAAFGVNGSIEILLGPIIGGAGTVFGPVLGAGVLECLSEVTRDLFEGYGGVHLMVYGVILIITIIFLPDGILGGLQSIFRKLKKRGRRH